MKICENCGKQYEDDNVRFCTECGGVLTDKNETAAEASVNPQEQTSIDTNQTSTYSPSYNNSNTYSYNPTPSAPKMTRMGIWGMALSLLMLSVAFNQIANMRSHEGGVVAIVMLFFAAPGLIFSIIGAVSCARGTRRGKWFGIVGIIAGILAILLPLVRM